MTRVEHEPLQIRDMAALYALGALSERERLAFDEHLEVSRESVDEVLSLLPVTCRLAYATAPREAPPALRDQVLEAVTGAAPAKAERAMSADELPAGGAAPTPAAADDDTLKLPTGAWSAADSTRRRGSAGPAAAWVISVVSLAVAAGLGWYAFQQRGLARALQENLDAANLQANLAEIETAAAQQVAAEAREQTAILAAPDVVTLNLEGQPTAPNASGQLHRSPTTGTLFIASGLPPLPPGRVYQLWLIPGAQPLGTALLQVDDAGRVATSVVLPEGVTGPVPAAVTMEPEGGAPSPGGEVYLLGRP